MNLRKSFARGVVGLVSVSLLGGCASEPEFIHEGMEVRGCTVTIRDNPALRDSGFAEGITSRYDFNRGQVRDDKGYKTWSMSFRDMYTKAAKAEVLTAYDATVEAGHDCPEPQFVLQPWAI